MTTLTGKERIFDVNDIIVSKTDLAGKMTYVNKIFMEVGGYTEDECLGIQHNLIRHPAMPRSIFHLLWIELQKEKEVFAFVLNRSKNGDHYWVLAHVTPSRDKNGNVVGYHSNRRVPDKKVIQDTIEPLYKQLLGIEKSNGKKDGMLKAYQTVVDMITEQDLEYNEFIFSLLK